MTVAEYRKKHPKCKYCEHYRFVVPPFPEVSCDGWCKAKEKVVNEDLPRPFCKVFKVKEEV